MAKQKTASGIAPTEATKVSKNRAEGLRIIETKTLPPSRFVLTDKFRGRAKPLGEDVVVERADSMREHGQQQAIQVRAIPGSDNYEIIFGNTRKRAADMIVSGYVGGDGKTYEPRPEFLLRAEVVEVDDETALKRNLIENHERSKTTAVDNAKNHQDLRETYKMSDAAITRFYGYNSQATVTRLKKLLGLEEEYQNAISDGRLTASAGFLLADVPAENRGKIWLAVVDAVGKGGEDTDINEGGVIGSSAMSAAIKAVNKAAKEAAEAAKLANTPTEGQTPPTDTPPTETPPVQTTPGNLTRAGKVSLTVKQFKEQVGKIADHQDCPDKCELVCQQFVKFISGDCDTKELAVFLASTVGGNPKPPKLPDVSPEAAKANAEAAGEPGAA